MAYHDGLLKQALVLMSAFPPRGFSLRIIPTHHSLPVRQPRRVIHGQMPRQAV